MDQKFLESLENRQLLSGSVPAIEGDFGFDTSVLRPGGFIRVDGGPTSDVIAISVNADQSIAVNINGVGPTNYQQPVNGVRIFGHGGNEEITVDEAALTNGTLPVTVHGGAGNNTITTVGHENDYIIGGAGDDSINVGNGNDLIHGGQGNNSIIAGSGNDIFFGGIGHDTFKDGGGHDTFICGAGSDSIITGGGSDSVLLDNDGADSVIGNIGSLGADTIWTFSGSDSITPGTNDQVNPGGVDHPVSGHMLITLFRGLRAEPVQPV